ncbi:tetratricopeptide repeat protein [Holophaga foetida]|uniref:tetratricopeptide repeat protein n=1 Tax=Holophaga foetida TaxID=35839 RepID=UPI0002472A99|nr:SEL1-like repeat protein [Holophaga foetida]
MSEQPATGPMPVTPQGPPPPEDPIDQTVRLQAGEPTRPESNKTVMMGSAASTHPFPQEGPIPEAPHPSASTQDLPVLFPDPTKTVTLGHLPEIPMADRLAAPAPAPVTPKRSGLWAGVLVGAGVAVIILAAAGFFGYRAGWFGERPAPPSYADGAPEEGTKAQTTPAIQPYLERAAAGDATAMQMLGYFYYYGLNVPQNRKEGLRWYHKAADAGSVSAQKELANLEGKSGQQ